MPDDAKISATNKRSLVVEGFTNSVLDPNEPMLGPIENGGIIIANTAPGCWGPMITPRLRAVGMKSQSLFMSIVQNPVTGLSSVSEMSR